MVQSSEWFDRIHDQPGIELFDDLLNEGVVLHRLARLLESRVLFGVQPLRNRLRYRLTVFKAELDGDIELRLQRCAELVLGTGHQMRHVARQPQPEHAAVASQPFALVSQLTGERHDVERINQSVPFFI